MENLHYHAAGVSALSVAVSLVSPFIAPCMALNKLYSLSRGLSKMPQC
ncbi:MAG: hypothetical protein MR290_03450 [Ruminococcus sp.]|nr:hypothetical protein [Ruminococcus sp.]